MNGVYVKQYFLPEYDKAEILRYMAVDKSCSDDSIMALVDECIAECNKNNVFSYNVCYTKLCVSVSECNVKIGEMNFKSNYFSNVLSSCDEAMIFAATLGIGIDRLTERYKIISPAKSLVFQAIGAERIEALCDMFCDDIVNLCGCKPTTRFSPGYGNIPLELQKNFFEILDCSKLLGLTLCDSMLMSPSKSVTAIAGLKRKEN